ncbi:universal stress protein [Actinoplanes sp. CA-252034]|uniref:universal stress protein n=1 Tax=Actinoplanes sp. CA-252034 TaxID=3239906 RepID=UPI003D954F48
MDGSDSSRRALEWAAGHAAGPDTAVRAVMAWVWDGVEAEVVYATPPAEERRQAGEVLDRQIKDVIARHGSSRPIAAEIVEGTPVDVLIADAENADLLVLGGHGHNRLRHAVLGSVSEECIRKAACPVVVIPAGTGKAERGGMS